MSDFDEIDSLLVQANNTAIVPLDNYWGSVPEDRYAAEEQVRRIYEGLGLKHPRMSWATSPKALYKATEILRNVHHGLRQNMVTDLVRHNDLVEMEARRAFMDAVLDHDMCVTTGASLQQQFVPRGAYKPRYLNDLDIALRCAFVPANLSGRVAPAGWGDGVVYPEAMLDRYPLVAQTLCILPYMKICWFCLPPTKTLVNENGRLLYIEFRDGWNLSLTPAEDLPTPTETDRALPPPESSAVRMLNAAAEELKNREKPDAEK